MSWFADLTRSLFDGIKSVGSSVVEATIPIIQRVTEASHRIVRAIEDGIRNEFRPAPSSEKEIIERDLADTNDRMQKLKKRQAERGSLTDSEKREASRLWERRRELMAELEVLSRVENAYDFAASEDAFNAIVIGDEQVHILQYHVGKQVLDKLCPTCKTRPMVLQWKRGETVTSTKCFYWGCSGFYLTPNCKTITQLSADDLQLFANLYRSEFAVSPSDLANYAKLKNPLRVIEALRSIKSSHGDEPGGICGYRCPIHGENLTLRENNDSKQNLDPTEHFFLGCPRWQYDKRGCNFILKLKSAAQISAVLETMTGNGLFATIENEAAVTSTTKVGGWTKIEEALLLQAFNAGGSVAQLAAKSRRSERAIEFKLHKLGVPIKITPYPTQ